MSSERSRILVVGLRASFDELLAGLEAAGCFQFDYVPSPELVRFFERSKPDVILLLVPTEKAAAAQVLRWLPILRGRVPVVVVSTAAQMDVYLTAMNHGALDYLTGYTPLEEVDRVLANAARRACQQAACGCEIQEIA